MYNKNRSAKHDKNKYTLTNRLQHKVKYHNVNKFEKLKYKFKSNNSKSNKFKSSLSHLTSQNSNRVSTIQSSDVAQDSTSVQSRTPSLALIVNI